MKHRDVAVILATGGMGLVRAAYSAGKPAYGVGPGNAPCFIERSADLAKAREKPVDGQPHPGAERKSGHFGFAGHNDPVAFRNIRIKTLAQ